MIGAKKNLKESCDLTMPLSGVFVVCGLGLAIFNLSTKFEVSVSTQYEDMKGNTK